MASHVFSTESLPTPVAQVARRLNIAGADGGAETFLMASYIVEVAIKLIGVALFSGLKEKAPDQAYRMGYDLVRADGLGTWETWIRQTTSQPLAGFLPVSYNELVAWATKARTKPEDDWFRNATTSIASIFEELGIENTIPERKPTARDLLAALIQLRNKTKAHGAVGADFFAAINAAYVEAVQLLITECPLFTWRWMHLSTRQNKTNRGILLIGGTPEHVKQAEVAPLHINEPGVHVWPTASVHPIACSDLLYSDHECSKFLLPTVVSRDSKHGFWTMGPAMLHSRPCHLSCARQPLLRQVRLRDVAASKSRATCSATCHRSRPVMFAGLRSRRSSNVDFAIGTIRLLPFMGVGALVRRVSHCAWHMLWLMNPTHSSIIWYGSAREILICALAAPSTYGPPS